MWIFYFNCLLALDASIQPSIISTFEKRFESIEHPTTSRSGRMSF